MQPSIVSEAPFPRGLFAVGHEIECPTATFGANSKHNTPKFPRTVSGDTMAFLGAIQEIFFKKYCKF
jgi:hypothetical protein